MNAKNFARQSMMWGYAVESWDRLGVLAMIAGGTLGMIALFLSLASAYILYRVADRSQHQLALETRESAERIARLNNETELLKAANLALQKRVGPRVLTKEQQQSIESVATTPFKVDFAFSASTDEDFSLALAISEPLIAAGWEWVDWPPPAMPLPNNRAIGRVMLNGIEVRGLNPKLTGMTKALVEAMRPMELGDVRESPDNASPQNQDAPMMIEIMIGPRR
jgi:hypothetical protein